MLSHRAVIAFILVTATSACSSDPEPASSSSSAWSASSTGFTLTVRGGLPAPALLPHDCSQNNYRITYQRSTGVLRMTGCYGASDVSTAVALDAAGKAAVDSAAATIVETSERGCGADFPEYVLSVESGATSRTWNSSFYAGCPGTMLTAPFASYDALSRFGATLVQLARTCASGDGGVTCTDAGAGS